VNKALKKKVLLIGWDAADWKVVNPLLDAGCMPALESLVNQGVIGNLATLDPPLSPMLWTSIATGVHADKHGILNFTEPAPHKGGIRPVMGTSRKVKAVWNILMQNGMKCHVVGWWPSHPAEPLNGITISNFYQRAHAPIDKPWPLFPGTVHPVEKMEIFDQLRIHPAELTEAHLLPFVPDAARIDQDKDHRLSALARIIADCSTIHAATTWILENEEWDFLAVYYDAIDHFSHGFMNFHPPRMKHIPRKLYELYKQVVTGGYIYHDMMLARLLQLAGEEVTVILVSDHGFHSDHLRPRAIPKEPAGPAWQHRPYGIFVMKGPNVKKDERIYGARLLDVAPTILNLYGLPAGKDMDGKPLVQAFEEPPPLNFIPSWESVTGECGRYPDNVLRDPYAEQEAMEQLIALGYVEKPDENVEKTLKRTSNESRFFLARVHINKNQYQNALPILESLYQENQKETRYAFQLAKCYYATRDIEKCRETTESILKKTKKETPQLQLLRGSLALIEKQYEKALEYLIKAESAEPRLPTLHQQIGQTYFRMCHFPDAERAFKKALEIDPDNAVSYDGLARVYLRMRRNEEAVSAALHAIGLLYYYPSAHYQLGMALARLGQYKRAAEAFEVVLAMAPGLKKAHRILKQLYTRRLSQPEKADQHAQILEMLRKQRNQGKGEMV